MIKVIDLEMIDFVLDCLDGFTLIRVLKRVEPFPSCGSRGISESGWLSRRKEEPQVKECR